jgi:hypothetical protein
VAPLKDDTSEEIVSWVDGQVVTDWAAEMTKRERAIDGYLNDADPGRAEKYGFRSGQNPRLAWSWFRNNPVGFNGVPFVLLKTILDLDPNGKSLLCCFDESDCLRSSGARSEWLSRWRSRAPASPSPEPIAQTPSSAGRTPAFTALSNAAWSCSTWSA